MVVNKIVYPSIEDRMTMGSRARQQTPPSSHAGTGRLL